jgi:molecular chaperone GrpE
MSEQQNDSKDGGETEKTAPDENIDTFAGDTGVTASENPDEPTDAAAFDELLRGLAEENLPDNGVWQEAVAVDEKNTELAELEAKTADLAAQLADTRDQLLRKAADFENSRKRMNAEKQNAIDFANQNLILDIIPILDDFERAIQSAESSGELTSLPAGKALLEGIVMIEKRMISRLEGKWGLKRFDSAGKPFDPVFHEAVLMDKSPDIGEPVVLEEYIKGYMLKDRVIRAAQVKVLMPENSS